ncbi:MAG: ATP-binding protein [Candidatus Micrarchaeota archaeon]|nr:ATP-binding protein [Candidatus Micrarchaeota archaeon]
MIDKFVDRHEELSALEGSGSKARLVVVYGRRRIGKTELINRYLKGKNASYYLATDQPLQEQLAIISGIVGHQIGDEELYRFPARDIEPILYKLHKKSLESKSAPILAIDEYPKLARADPSLTSKLQRSWDMYLSKGKAVLILSGSSTSMMHSEVLNYSAPLYGRSSTILRLKTLPFRYAAQLMPRGITFVDKLRLYFILGGIPAYYGLTGGFKGGIGGIVNSMVAEGSAFLSEPSLLLSEEVRNDRRYIAVLNAVANGLRKPNEIANAIGINQNNLSRYTTLLEQVGLLAKEYPAASSSRTRLSKQGNYVVADNFTNFYFTNLYPKMGMLDAGQRDEAAKTIVGELDMLSSRRFERFSTEFLLQSLSRMEHGFEITEIGRWWGRDPARRIGTNEEEIDVVALNGNTGDILFGECKWTSGPLGADVYSDLKRKAALVRWRNGKRREHFALFSKGGFTQGMERLAKGEGAMLFDLGRIEDEMSRAAKRGK